MSPAPRAVEALTGWRADWAGLRVVVLGLGVTGFAVADTLAELGARVLVVARDAEPAAERILEVLGVEFLQTAEPVPSRVADFDPELVVTSPGPRPDHPLPVWAVERGVPVWGDVELAWRLRDKTGEPADWILVTGTNGKTTTTRMAAAMLTAAGRRAAACGNIGVPVLDAIRDPSGFQALVVELSSFQLHRLPASGPGSPVPLASVCLNIRHDHLDWHGGFAAYRSAKAAVYRHTRAACVYNRADPETEAMVREADVIAGARAVGFGLDVPGVGELGVVDGILCDRAFGADRRTSALELATVDELRDRGLAAPHIVADALAAAALARSAGAEPAAVHEALASVVLDPHRIQPVHSAAGVDWVDDSKATNPHAAAASLASFDSVVWIAGGLFKGVDVEPLVAENAPRLRGAVLIGADREPLRRAFARHAPALPVFEVDADETGTVMPEAVRLAARIAREGDTVLLAPAAASMDQFTDYAARGEAFQEAVRRHARGEP